MTIRTVTSCSHCKRDSDASTSFLVVNISMDAVQSHGLRTEHFCSRECAITWFQNRLLEHVWLPEKRVVRPG